MFFSQVAKRRRGVCVNGALFTALALLFVGAAPNEARAQAACPTGSTANTNTAVTVNAANSTSEQKVHGENYQGQTFTVTGSGCFQLTRITISVQRFDQSGTMPADLVVEIQGAASNQPNGTVLASKTVPASSVATGSFTNLAVDFTTPALVTGGSQYALVIHQLANGGTGGRYYHLGLNNGGPYTGGQYCKSGDSGGTWACPGNNVLGNSGSIDVSLSICVAPCSGGGLCTETPCCTLTQGAYGAPGGAGPAALAASILAGSNPFMLSGSPQTNATTIGVPGTKSATIGDHPTLQNYLPAGGTPGQLTVSGDNIYTIGNPLPAGGIGGGTLASQTMTCGLNAFISDVPGVFQASAVVLGDFTLPAGGLLCTRRFGGNTALGGGDDVCAAFSYPACSAGRTVSEVQAAANNFLGTGLSSGPGNLANCTASELEDAVSNVNDQFDGCAVVIACEDASENEVTAAGSFDCPALP